MSTKINADFSRRAALHSARLDWIPSPIPGVDRKMLDRVGGEVARATSIVRYAPGSKFSPHVHDGGEEFLVLSGVFQDEHGDYPAGSYVRNPPQSSHTPGSAAGCVIFVKLWQFDPSDRKQVSINAIAPGRDPVTTLHHDECETVRIERWAPGARLKAVPVGGIEIFCLQGGFEEDGDIFGRRSWLRLPVDAPLDAIVGSEGCLLWVKEGHLRHITLPPQATKEAAQQEGDGDE